MIPNPHGNREIGRPLCIGRIKLNCKPGSFETICDDLNLINWLDFVVTMVNFRGQSCLLLTEHSVPCYGELLLKYTTGKGLKLCAYSLPKKKSRYGCYVRW